MSTDNPLLPLVRELAEALAGRGGKLYSKCSATGPRDLEELGRLLHVAGMPAAAWLIESEAARVAGVENDLAELENEENHTADIASIRVIMSRSTPMAAKLKEIAAIVQLEDAPPYVPPAPPPVPGFAVDDDVPF